MLTKELIKYCTFGKIVCIAKTQMGVWGQCPGSWKQIGVWGESLNSWANFGFLLAKIMTFCDHF